MQSEILIFTDNAPARISTIEVVPFAKDFFLEIRKRQRVAICLMDRTFLPEMRKDPDCFIDRGVRHPKSELARYFHGGNSKIPFIDGINYKDFGQLKRSINDFIRRLMQSDMWNEVFIIGASSELLNEGRRRMVSALKPTETGRKNYRDPLLNMITRISAPSDLCDRFIGNSEPCILVRQMITIAAQKDFPVLILGESGTGKEVTARAVHEYSSRSGKPFITINCSAISPELLESELFGYKRGAFTGARSDKKGLWEMAGKGTLFLDEIGDLLPGHQAKILRAIDNNEIQPVGGTAAVKVYARIIAATNKNIESRPGKGKSEFREDLYYRISTFIIRTPPLSSHPEDIPELAGRFWSLLGNKRLTGSVLDQLKYMNWPGNVRSLKYFLERLHAMFGDEQITVEHIKVLQNQDLENFLKTVADQKRLTAHDDEKTYEKAVTKIEYLLKASVVTEDPEKRRELLENAKESIEEIM